MATTRYRHVGYGDRVGGSIKGIFGGVIAILASVVLLWWNEGNSLKEIKRVNEGRKNTVEVQSNAVLPENEGQLIHLNGKVTTSDTLVNTDYGFNVNAIKFRQVVEMYQYKEKKETEKVGSGDYIDTYTYQEVWSSTLINSNDFVEDWRDNPEEFYHEGESLTAKNVQLNAFDLSGNLIDKMGGYEAFNITEDLLKDSIEGIIHKGKIFFGYEPKFPEIGDERIYFEVIYPQEASVIAQQSGNSFVPYITKGDRKIEMIHLGLQTAEEMYIAEEQKNTLMRWLLRALGFMLMFGGLGAMLRPISAVLGGLPLIGNVLEEGAGALIGIVAGLVAISGTFIVIAVAWVFHRPLVGLGLLAFAAVMLYLTKKFAEPPAVKESLE